MDIASYLDTAIMAIIAGVISIAVKYVVSLIKNSRIDDFVMKTVKEAEVIYADPKQGEQKYAAVAKAVTDFAESKLHIKLDEKYVSKLIESAVVDFKLSIGEALKK